jgi:uncharacterized membrane protein (DUF373 family)
VSQHVVLPGRLASFSQAFVNASTFWLHFGQGLVLIVVAGVLLLAGLVIVLDTVQELVNAIAARSIAEAIFSIVENALLALILAELVHTLLVSLAGEGLSVEPFLVIAIVGILRKMLLTTVGAPKPGAAETLISPLVAELFVLGLLILVLGASLALSRRVRS